MFAVLHGDVRVRVGRLLRQLQALLHVRVIGKAALVGADEGDVVDKDLVAQRVAGAH